MKSQAETKADKKRAAKKSEVKAANRPQKPYTIWSDKHLFARLDRLEKLLFGNKLSLQAGPLQNAPTAAPIVASTTKKEKEMTTKSAEAKKNKEKMAKVRAAKEAKAAKLAAEKEKKAKAATKKTTKKTTTKAEKETKKVAKKKTAKVTKTTKAKKAPKVAVFEKGDRVVAEVEKSYFLGTVLRPLDKGGYRVKFDDGDKLDVKAKAMVGAGRTKKFSKAITKKELKEFLASS